MSAAALPSAVDWKGGGSFGEFRRQPRRPVVVNVAAYVRPLRDPAHVMGDDACRNASRPMPK